MSKLRIRPAQAKDKPAVEAICAQIWDGHDYVPEIWGTWLADPFGSLVVAELEGRAVGFAKLTRLADDEWWLEGLRVDRAHRREGIATRLHTHLVAEARRVGRGVLRFGTHSRNEPIHRIAACEGFRQIAAYRLYRADPLPAARAPGLRRLTGADLPAAWDLVEAFPHVRGAGRLYEVGWKWKTLTRERLAAHLAAGEAWGAGDEGALAGLALTFQVPADDALRVGYVGGSSEALATVLRGLRGLASRRDGAGVGFKPVDEPALVAAVEAAGYEPDWDRDVWIYELELN